MSQIQAYLPWNQEHGQYLSRPQCANTWPLSHTWCYWSPNICTRIQSSSTLFTIIKSVYSKVKEKITESYMNTDALSSMLIEDISTCW